MILLRPGAAACSPPASTATLLLRTDLPITQIGRMVGWPDQNYFARRFRAHFGLNATTYRKQFSHTTARLRTWLADGASTPD